MKKLHYFISFDGGGGGLGEITLNTDFFLTSTMI